MVEFIKNFGGKIMKFKKLGAVTLAAAVFVSSMAGCSKKTDWVMKSGDYTIGSGEYIYFVTSNTEKGLSKVNISTVSKEYKSDTKKLFKSTIEGKSANDWIKDMSLEQAKNMLGARIEFDNLGLSFDASDTAQNKQKYMQEYGMNATSKHYDEIGISQESYQDMVEDQAKYDKVYDYYYGENGQEKISDEQKDEYTRNHGANFKSITIFKKESTSFSQYQKGERRTADQQIEITKKMIDEGKNIDDINKDYQNSKGIEDVSELGKTYLYEDDDTKDQVTMDAVFNKAQLGGAPVIVETDEWYKIIQRVDINDKTCESNRDTSAKKVSYDAFKEKLDKSAEDKGYTQNNSAISKYSPKKQRKRQDKIMIKAQEQSNSQSSN